MTRVQEKWLVMISPLVLALVVGAVIVGVLRARAEESRRWESESLSDAGSPAALPVTVITLGELATPSVNDRYRGVIIASKEAELSFRRGGRVASIEVTEGAMVRRGEVLAALDAADIEARIAVAQAQLAESQSMLAELLSGPRKQTIDAAEADVRRLEATVELAQTTATRQQSLVAVNASSYQQYDDAKSALEQQHAALISAEQRLSELREGTRKEQVDAQRSRVEAIRAQLRSLDVELSDSRIVAPFAGVIARRYLDDGVVVGPQTRALRLLQLDPLEARFGLSAIDAASLRIGQSVKLTLGQHQIAANVARIEPEIDLTTRTQGVFLTIVAQPPQSGSNDDSANESGRGAIVPGQTVSLANFSASGNASPDAAAGDGARRGSAEGAAAELWVPLTALSRANRGMWSLFVVVESPPADGEPQADSSDGEHSFSFSDNAVATDPNTASSNGNAPIQYVIERREVHVLAIESDLARVNGSLVAAGDLIVSTALHRVAPGMKVEPVK